MQRKNRHGIVLITTMLFVTVIVMIATLIATQGKMALLSGTASMQSEEAYMAALSGIDFVRGELKKDKSFGTYSLSGYKKKVPNSPASGFLVNYNNNDLIGYIGATSNNDYKSKFSVSFKDNSVANHGGDTNYKHASSACKYLSVNNVNSTFQIDKDMSKGVRRNVPPYSVYIVSKGVCGKSVRYVEAFVTSNGPSAVDNGTTIGGDINITSGVKDTSIYKDDNYLLNIYHVDDKYPGQINAFNSDGKCTKDVKLTAGNCSVENLLNLKNKVTINGKFDKSAITDTNHASNLSVSQTAIIDTANLNDLSMQDAKGNLDTTLSSFSLDPGSYVYLRDFSEDEMKAKWVYVNEKELGSRNASNTLINAIKNENFTDVLSNADIASNSAISFGKSDIAGFQSRTITVNGNVNVTDNVNFVVIDKFDKNRYSMETSTVDFQLNKGSIVSEKGSINIRGEVVGNGNLVAGKNIDINAGSALEVDKEQKVTIYAEEDININRAKNLSNRSLRRQFNFITNSNNSNSSEPTLSNNQIKRFELGLVADDVDSTINTNEETGSSSFTTDLSNVGITCTPICLDGTEFAQYIDKLYDLNINGDHYYIPCVNTGGNGANKDNSPKISIIKDMTGLIEKNEGDIDNYTGLDRNLQFVFGFNDNTTSCRKKFTSIGDKEFYISHAEGTNSAKDFNLFVQVNGKYYFCGKLDFGTTNIYTSEGNKNQYDLRELPEYTKDNMGTYSELNLELAKSVNEENGSSSNNATLTDTDNAKKALSEDEKKLASDIYVSKTSLVGTVYSKKGSIKINIGATAFDIIGALITCDGDLDITASKVNLTYDPDYVPFFKDTGIQTKLRFLSSFVGGE